MTRADGRGAFDALTRQLATPAHHARLDNGLEVVAAPLPHLHTATMALFVRAGSRYEDARTNGLSHFLEHMLFRGTERHPSAYELNLAIEELGGTLYAATHVDFTMYQLTLPPETMEDGLERFAEIFAAPVFRDLEVEKGIVREELLEDVDEDGREIDVDNVVRDLMFSPHPLGFKISGSIDTVRAFEEADLRAHMARHYGARNMVLALSGAIDHERMMDTARRAFEGLPAGQRTDASAWSPVAPARRFLCVEDSGSQTDLRISFPCFGLSDPRFPAMSLLGRVLDDGMSTRLHRRICDERGLAYDVFAELDPFEDCSAFDFGVSVAHDKTPQVVGELLGLARELRERPVSEAELDKARRRSLWHLRETLDHDEGLASLHGVNRLFGLEEDLAQTATRLLAVSADDIQAVAHEVLDPAAAHTACVGQLTRAEERRTRSVLGL